LARKPVYPGVPGLLTSAVPCIRLTGKLIVPFSQDELNVEKSRVKLNSVFPDPDVTLSCTGIEPTAAAEPVVVAGVAVPVQFPFNAASSCAGEIVATLVVAEHPARLRATTIKIPKALTRFMFSFLFLAPYLRKVMRGQSPKVTKRL
jgi:hypothetical protein